MRPNLTTLVKLALFAALALTFYKGLSRTPEAATRLDPERFYRDQLNVAENSLIMKERHFDFNHLTLKALQLRQVELCAPGAAAPKPDELVCQERTAKAMLKAQARDMRNAEYLTLAQEAVDRAKNMRATGWVMPIWGCPCPSSPGGVSLPSAGGDFQPNAGGVISPIAGGDPLAVGQ